MKHASIAALKARLSEYLTAVAAGEEVIVTHRGRPVARLAPLSGTGASESRAAALIRAGLARAPETALPDGFVERSRPNDPEGRSLAALLEEREGGW